VKLYIAETWTSHESTELLGVFDSKEAAVNEVKLRMKDYGQVYWVELNTSVNYWEDCTQHTDANHIVWGRYPTNSIGE
jgi:hypothetical protein